MNDEISNQAQIKNCDRWQDKLITNLAGLCLAIDRYVYFDWLVEKLCKY